MLITVAPLNGMVMRANALTGSTTEEKIWNYLKSNGFNNYGTAGLMGNLYAESALNSKNLQNSYESKLGYTDSTYTNAVDNGTYSKSKFIHDAAGYGLAQWTYYTRKEKLYNYAKEKGKSIGDLETQLAFLCKELSGSYSGVNKTLKNATSLKEASNAVLLKFEKPANTGTSAQNTRLSYSQKYYDKFVKGTASSSSSSTTADEIILMAQSQKKSYGSDNNKFTKWFYGKEYSAAWCAIFVSWCANEVGALGKIIPKEAACKNMATWFKNRGEYHSESSYTPQKGDIVFFSTDGTSTAHHVEFVSESGFITENSKKKVKCVGGNTSDSNFKGADYVAEKKRWVNEPSCKILGYAHPSYQSVSYKVTNKDTSSVNNTSAVINASLDKKASVKKWGYAISCNDNDKNGAYMNKINLEDNNTHEPSYLSSNYGGSISWHKVKDWDSDPQSVKDLSYTLSNLKPGKTYYIKFAVKLASKKWIQSGVKSFTTTSVKPGTPKLRVSNGSSTIGIGDQATVLWDGTSNTDSYTLKIKAPSGTVIKTKTGIKGTTDVLNYFNSAGTYSVEISSVNGAGTTVGNTVEIEVKPNVTVTFFDTISNQNIAQVTVPYGHAADAPKTPVQEGHTFTKWDKAFDKVTSDLIVNTVYDLNSYTVKFIDSFTKKVLKTQTVKYMESATAPNAVPPEEGYSLVGWDKDFSSVNSDMDVYTVFKWTDKDHNSTIKIDSVTRNSTKQGYDVTVTVKNMVENIISGRVVFALKSQNQVILTSTESEAFAIDKMVDSKPTEKQISIFVPYTGLAYSVSVYVINSYESLGTLSEAVSMTIDNSTSSAWSPWITYTDDCPIANGNGVTVETRTVEDTTTKTYYRYKTKTTTTSKATSLSGYTQNGYTKVKNSSGTVSYVSSWPEGFLKSNSLYTKYNVKPKTATSSQIIESTTTTQGYIYWHWCRGGSYGAINRGIEWEKKSPCTTFHAFYNADEKTFDKSANAVAFKKTDVCKDTYWWNSIESGNKNLVTVKKQTYTLYDKLYNYYKISDYSAWKEYTGSAPVSNGASAGTNKVYQNVETKTETSTTYTKQYRYMTSSNPVIQEPEVNEKQIVNYTYISDWGSEYAGKDITYWVYKYNQASDFTVECVGRGKLDGNGNYTINDIAKEPISIETKDFTIAVAVEGQAKAFIVGKIEAPKPKYTVTFYDYDRETVISTQEITEGDNATLPSASLLTIPEGMRFTNWSQSVVNVRSELNVYPEAETKVFVVAFVNWETKSVELIEFMYGEELTAASEPECLEGYSTQWVVDVNGTKMTLAEYADEGYTVTENMVVGTESTLTTHEIIFIDPVNAPDDYKDIDPDNLEEVGIIDRNETEYGDLIDFGKVEADVEDNPDYIFFGWINIDSGEYVVDSQVTDDMILYPSYVFAETTETPYADIENGEYNSAQTVTLTCDTPNSVIFYTIDGTDPVTSETAIEYTEPITLTESCQLKYCASTLGMNDSGTVTSLYAINTATSGKAFHIVNIVCNIEQYEGYYYEILMSNGKLSRDIISDLTNMEGYNFDGLYLDEEFDEDFDYQNEYVTESMTLYANYIPEQFEVVFKDSDGNVIATENVDYMNSAEPPVAPTKDGYVFVGWDSEEYELVTSNVTLTAKYVLESEYARITLKKHTGSYSVGSSVTLKYTITPYDLSETEIEWISSDEDIATVNENGTVTFVGDGTVTISATVVATGESDKCVFTVLGDPDKTLTLDINSYLGFDSAHYIRGVKTDLNTVKDIKAQFMNDNLKVFNSKGDLLADSDLVGTGATVELYEGDVLLDYAIVIMTGDVNCDGKINNRDAAYITRYIVEKENPSFEYEMIALDVNGDGKVNNRDASMLSRYLVGKEVL